ncbi:MAG: hypothetical protein A3B71_07515 [Gammaproteobacteria bacterium RIFCSPHIGHO2_02_FULL_42_43]|nr:MAG: hypothetical protein A3B71_07515 [Gammaproteobacteria bacterium RIFCSPHIGHO2_02_FULL_42_43]
MLVEKAHHWLSQTPDMLAAGLRMTDVLSVLQCDDETQAAALLYPLIAQDRKKLDHVKKELSPVVAQLISGAFQIDAIREARGGKNRGTGQQDQIDNLRKMMLAMVDDMRTIYIKLAQHLIALQNAQTETVDHQKKLAQDTFDYYAPLANRLGIGHFKWQLEDWAFRYMDPAEYQQIAAALQMHNEERVQFIHQMIAELKMLMSDGKLPNAKVSGRIKHIYSIYRKRVRKKVSLSEIYDTNAVRILVSTVEECYKALSLVHEKWTPIAKEFDDYIAKPKANGYQSIHTAVTLPNKKHTEIQIRTIEMHEKAELGLASHWSYKENKKVGAEESEKIIWLRTLLDWQKNALASSEMQSSLYQKAFSDRVYVFSPLGNVFDLPLGSTPLDFAYLVHTSIGHRCRGAKVNNVLVPLTHQLKTGDRVDIVTGKEQRPSADWMRKDTGFLKSLHAIRKVRHWFYQQQAEEKKKSKTEETESATTKKVSKKIIKTKTQKPSTISVAGEKYLLTQIAKCCQPQKNDAIIGYVTLGRGISVHKKNCHNIDMARKRRPEKLIDVTWNK